MNDVHVLTPMSTLELRKGGLEIAVGEKAE